MRDWDTRGQQKQYLLPHEVSTARLHCPNCGDRDWIKSDKNAKGEKKVVCYCNNCQKMHRMRIAEWTAYLRRFENE